MSRSKITTLANEVFDNIFGYLVDKKDALALCKTHRSFKASGQRFLFRNIRIPVQCVKDSTGRFSMLLGALNDMPRLSDSVETLQIDFQLQDPYPHGHFVLERAAVLAILSKLPNLKQLIVFIVDQAHTYGQPDFASDVAQLLREQTTTKQITINTPSYHLFQIRELFSLPRPSNIPRPVLPPLATTLVVRAGERPPRDAVLPTQSGRMIWILRNDSPSFAALTAIDYSAHVAPKTVANFAAAKNLEKLRFVWFDGDLVHRLHQCIENLYPVRDTLKELTIVRDNRYHTTPQAWRETDFSSFTALKILRVPALAFYEGVACQTSGLRAELVDRSSITHLLPPNLQELELAFRYPAGIFATRMVFLPRFQKLSEHEGVQGFDWILALLQLQSLRRVRLVEQLCTHQVGSVQPSEGASTRKYTPPDMVGQAFREAETELEIQVLPVIWEEPRCELVEAEPIRLRITRPRLR